MIADDGFSAWLDDPTSGTEFLVLLATPIALVGVAVYGIGEWLTRRAHAEEIRRRRSEF